MLKRIMVPGLCVVAMSGCGASGVGLLQTPSSVLAAAVVATTAIQNYTVTFDAHESFPGSSQSSLFSGSSGATGSTGTTTTTENFKGSFKAVKPDRLALDASVKFNGFSVDISTVRIGADNYTKDIFSGRWKKEAAATGATGTTSTDTAKSISGFDPATFTDLMKYLTVDQALADTDINGTHTHHYKVKLNTAKLRADLVQKGVIKDAKTGKAFDDLVNSGSYKMEIWIGTSDNLLRRATISIDGTTDASTLGGFSLGGTGSSTKPTPQPVHVTGQAQLDYSNFNKTTVSPPL